MILVDYSGIAMGALFARGGGDEEPLIRHFILNSLRMYNVKHRDEYGRMIVCGDGGSWRKEYYPEYKASRKTNREKDSRDWDKIFNTFTNVRNEIAEHLPFDVIHEFGVEADDIIATLVQETQEFGKHEPIMIISADKDFIQLHKHGNVKQYSPITRKMVSHEDPVLYLREHIFRGDAGDGVPNVLSSDDTFIDEDKKQTPLSKKKIQTWLDDYDNLENVMPSQAYRNYQRNKKVIDLEEIPQEVTTKILDKYNSLKPTPNMKALNYLIVNRMNNLVESVGDFHRK
jgi:5'-3' exonuclease